MSSAARTTVWGKGVSFLQFSAGSALRPDSVHQSLSLSLSPLSSNVAPALGLAWANQVTVRLMMRRLQGTVARGDQHSALRRLEVAFAPHLARDGRDAGVWREGVRGVLNPDS